MLALLLLAACRWASPAEPLLDHVISDPPGGGPAPLVVAVHGLGDAPNSLVGLVRRCGLPVRIVAPRGPERHHQGYSWFDVHFEPGGARVDARDIASAADRVAALIDALSARDDVVGKPVITGFSQGGFVSFAVATRHPDAVALAIPIAGGLPTELEPGPAPRGAPTIFALHGDSDPIVPPAPTRDAVHRLEAAGWDASLRVFANVQHSVPQAVHAALCERLSDVVQ